MIESHVSLPPEVTLATPADFHELFDVCMENYRENGIYSLNHEKVASWILMGCNQDNSVIGIVRGEHRIEAAIALYLSNMWYSDDRYIEEIFNFVRPEFRTTTHAQHLIRFAKWFAESLKLPLLIGIMTTTRLAAKERLYARQLPKIGALYLHGLPYVEEQIAEDMKIHKRGRRKKPAPLTQTELPHLNGTG